MPDRLDVSLTLQSLRICDLKISVKRIICALCLLRNSPNLIELDIDEVVKVMIVILFVCNNTLALGCTLVVRL